jgi:acyl-CoA reductase-like NAD-dependent aldehyde dehydrogenase
LNALDAFKNLDGHHLIDGRLVAGSGNPGAAIIDPATELQIGQIVDATTAEIDLAVEIANLAEKRWRKINYHKRAELLHEAARKMRDTRSLVGEMLTREMGKPFKESVDEVIWSSTATDYYAEVGRHEAGRVLGPVVDGQFNFTTKDPLGVVVIILPFNYPLRLRLSRRVTPLSSSRRN